MWLTDVAIRRPVFIIMFVLALIVMGLKSRSGMPQELNPKIDIPYITVVTTYAGAGPNEMETLVTQPIEKTVSSIGNLKNVTSTSQNSVSVVVLEFELGTDLNAVAADARDKVSSIRESLPEDADESKILKVDIASMPIMTIGLTGPVSPKDMRILADDVITQRLGKVGGIASINVSGGEQREISVAVNKNRLDAYGIGLDKVIGAMSMNNMNVPAGSIKEGARDYSIRTVGEYRTAKEVADTRLFIEGKGGAYDSTVRIGDIAEVSDTVAEPDSLTRLNGEPSVVINIQKQSDANTVSVVDGVKEELEAMKAFLPEGVDFVMANDQSVFVKESLNDVNKSLLEGILLVVIIVFLFLHTIRATFIVAVAIPTSIMATFLPIGSFGFTQNTMTLLALSLVVGILVDDSIVVLENIERHLRLRESPRQAAYSGRSEIGLAAITITMVDIVVFLPIAFMGGIVGQFFRQFGVTVACATAFSLLMSFTLTPMLASKWMKSEEDKERDEEALKGRLQRGEGKLKDRLDYLSGIIFDALERFLKRVDASYRGVLEWALHNRYLTVIIGIVSLLTIFATILPPPGPAKEQAGRLVIALLALVLVAMSLGIDKKSRGVAIVFGLVTIFIILAIRLPFGFGFFPQVDEGRLTVSIRTPPGTSLEETDKVVRRIEETIDKLPEMQPHIYTVSDAKLFDPKTWKNKHTEEEKAYYFSIVGASSGSGLGGGDTGPQYGYISITLVDKEYRERGVADVAQWLSTQVADIPGAEFISVSASEEHGPGSGVQKDVQGQNMDDILAEANRVADVIRRTKGAIDVDISYKPSLPERRIIVDRVKAASMDMSVAQVALAIRKAIDGDDSVKLRDGGSEYPIRVHYALSERSQVSDLGNMIVATKGGAPIYLKDIAEIKYDIAPTKIDRKNQQRVVYVTANLALGAQQGNVNNDIDKSLKEIPHVPGTTIETGGSSQMMIESFGYMISALILAILLVYMLMGALFESFLTPLVIIMSLPQAMIGALLALLVTGKSLSIVSMIGIIMLMGLVTKNAILLVDYTNTLRERGKKRHEAILEAGPTRLRPIMMTTFAMVGGMMPTALALSKGSEMRSPMAIAVIGGLIVSTMLTLIVIPVVYTIVDDLWHGILKRVAPEKEKKDSGVL